MKSQSREACRHRELFTNPSAGYNSLRKARARLLAFKSQGRSDVELKAMLEKSRLVAIDLDAFLAADTREKMLRCVAPVLLKRDASGAQDEPSAGGEPSTQTQQ